MRKKSVSDLQNSLIDLELELQRLTDEDKVYKGRVSSSVRDAKEEIGKCRSRVTQLEQDFFLLLDYLGLEVENVPAKRVLKKNNGN